jgi:hypothetical protein
MPSIRQLKIRTMNNPVARIKYRSLFFCWLVFIPAVSIASGDS